FNAEKRSLFMSNIEINTPLHILPHGAEIEALSIDQAAALLGMSEKEIMVLIENKTLCASFDAETGKWQIDAACVSAQREAEGKPNQTTESFSELLDMNPPAEAQGGEETVGSTIIEIQNADENQQNEVFPIAKDHVHNLMESLEFAGFRLEKAMY